MLGSKRSLSWLGSCSSVVILFTFANCSSDDDAIPPSTFDGGSGSSGTSGTDAGTGGAGATPSTGGRDGGGLNPDASNECNTTCAEAGWACGQMIDPCGNVVDCADEGLGCGEGQICVGGIDAPAECQVGLGGTCELCSAVPDCSDADQTTLLRGRVVSPGRDDDDVGNQVGIPNALVYILRNNDLDELPAIDSGVPAGAERCERCEEQELGPVLTGGITDASGHFELEGSVPVGAEFVLVVKAGKFRRAVQLTLPESAACSTTTLSTTLPDNPTRLPRDRSDGLAVNIPRVAVSTGKIDAMECVLYKMGLAQDVFGDPGSDRPIHLYHGARYDDRPAGGAWPDDEQARSCAACADCGDGGNQSSRNCRTNNCGDSSVDAKYAYLADNCAAYLDTRLLEDASRLESYDMLVFDCQGSSYDHFHDGGDTDSWDQDFVGHRRQQYGAGVREYLNRGGRMFASHLGHTWLYENGDQAYSADAPWETGLGAVAEWQYRYGGSLPNSGTGQIALTEYVDADKTWTEANVSPRIEGFAAWMESEQITSADEDHSFALVEPRSMCEVPGEHAEVFVDGIEPHTGSSAVATRVQQFSFNTPYGAPEEAACGRVAYSGFHVSAGGGSSPFENAIFPEHCTGSLGNDGVLTDQEKVLLYMLFDLGACVGETPTCVPTTCEGLGVQCGLTADGCGNVLNCGTCGVE